MKNRDVRLGIIWCNSRKSGRQFQRICILNIFASHSTNLVQSQMLNLCSGFDSPGVTCIVHWSPEVAFLFLLQGLLYRFLHFLFATVCCSLALLSVSLRSALSGMEPEQEDGPQTETDCLGGRGWGRVLIKRQMSHVFNQNCVFLRGGGVHGSCTWYLLNVKKNNNNTLLSNSVWKKSVQIKRSKYAFFNWLIMTSCKILHAPFYATNLMSRTTPWLNRRGSPTQLQKEEPACKKCKSLCVRGFAKPILTYIHSNAAENRHILNN